MLKATNVEINSFQALIILEALKTESGYWENEMLNAENEHDEKHYERLMKNADNVYMYIEAETKCLME